VFDRPYADPGKGVNDLFVENRTMVVYAQPPVPRPTVYGSLWTHWWLILANSTLGRPGAKPQSCK
jgi:hypothetical protein